MGKAENGGVLSGVNISKEKEAIVNEVAEVEGMISEGAGEFVAAAISTLAGNEGKIVQDISAKKESVQSVVTQTVLGGVKIDAEKAMQVGSVADTERHISEGSDNQTKKTLGNAMGVD